MNPVKESPLHSGNNIDAAVTSPHPYKDSRPEPSTFTLRFDAGDGEKHKATHKSIEKALEDIGFKELEIRAIYFGNWLRDYSQLLDPKIVRSTRMPKNFPDVLSREALTKIVDVLAVREFTDLMKIDRERFRVTPERLGVYRPSEHIDNPKVSKPDPADPTSRDQDFEPWVLPDSPLLDVDYSTSIKRYVKRSAQFMTAELNHAAKVGLESTEGLRAFGAGLHVLEDFFSHSNFVELSLIKLGYTDVLPWTSKADCKHGLPLVTGMFGSTDVIASLAAPLGEILFSVNKTGFTPIKAGERSERDQIIQILLSEHPDQEYLKAYETFLDARDKWADLPYSDYIEAILHYMQLPGQLVGNAIGKVMQGLMIVLGNSIGAAQTIVDDDPNTSGSTDPSHSQLAKDHAEHPLHGLAALLARHAVMHVGQNMLGQWLGKSESADAAQTAADYLAHPMDTTWQDAIVQEWANQNLDRVKRAANKSELDRIAERMKNHALEALENFKKKGSGFLDTFLNEENPLVKLWKLTPIGWYLTRK